MLTTITNTTAVIYICCIRTTIVLYNPEHICTVVTYAIKMIDKVGNVTTVNVVLDELGHDYGEQTETWSADYSEVTLKRVCSRDESHVLNETLTTTYVETKAPKCEETGTGTYTGTPTKDGLTSVTKDVVVDATGHDWGTPVYTWQNNDSEVYAKAICNNDNSHIIEETATVTHDIIKPATCEEDGSQGNVARFTKDVFEDQSKDATVINKLGHDLKETITVQPTLGGVEAVKKYDCQRESLSGMITEPSGTPSLPSSILPSLPISSGVTSNVTSISVPSSNTIWYFKITFSIMSLRLIGMVTPRRNVREMVVTIVK